MGVAYGDYQAWEQLEEATDGENRTGKPSMGGDDRLCPSRIAHSKNVVFRCD